MAKSLNLVTTTIYKTGEEPKAQLPWMTYALEKGIQLNTLLFYKKPFCRLTNFIAQRNWVTKVVESHSQYFLSFDWFAGMAQTMYLPRQDQPILVLEYNTTARENAHILNSFFVQQLTLSKTGQVPDLLFRTSNAQHLTSLSTTAAKVYNVLKAQL